ncbi:hypothetical protein AG1IA_01209 [Rhizoctonia solani AG-1 IA]|uniref:Uncharacterized protein n=1 Tax=Thanatephorus cucumeris (strain AG1-IA) TaxID=983506 RepID=L8X3M5_THACA|nr:hypothetical protein AG1IA_01209 [Rhizoctonia solani AG-1 IA]
MWHTKHASETNPLDDLRSLYPTELMRNLILLPRKRPEAWVSTLSNLYKAPLPQYLAWWGLPVALAMSLQEILKITNFHTQRELTDFLINNQRTRYVELVWVRPPAFLRCITALTTGAHSTNHGHADPSLVVLGGGPTDAVSLITLGRANSHIVHFPLVVSWCQGFQYPTSPLKSVEQLFALAKVPGLDWYSQDKRIIYPVIGLFFAQAAGMAGIIGNSFANMKAFESILFGLALFKAYQHVSRKQGIRPGWSGPRILSVLVRDSIMYFAVIFVTYIINLVSWSTGGSGIYQLAIALAIALRASMGSRLLLNVREAYYGCSVISDNMLSTIQWQPRNADCVAMDSLPVPARDHQTSTGFSSLPELRRDWSPEESLPGPSSGVSSQTKSRARVTFEPPYTP